MSVNMLRWLAGVAAAAVLLIAGGLAAQQRMPHQMPMHGQMQHGSGGSASTAAYQAAAAKMHADMDIAYTGDADKDFVAGMIAHHQGAIDSANVVLQYGKDADIRKLAHEIIAAQSKEITFLREWQKRNP